MKVVMWSVVLFGEINVDVVVVGVGVMFSTLDEWRRRECVKEEKKCMVLPNWE